jgi:hypothetical protein
MVRVLGHKKYVSKIGFTNYNFAVSLKEVRSFEVIDVC